MESMILTPRLACMAALVPQNARLADIGTDHGKLPISLLLDGHIASAIGSDIRSGPLAHAERNAKEHNVSLSLRLAPGLEAVRAEECDTVTIAGMGGQTIAEILTAAPWTGQGDHLLLLQPMTMIAELRRWLYAHGYAIERETLCRGQTALRRSQRTRRCTEAGNTVERMCGFSGLAACRGCRRLP